jgi:hypothetical protein
VTDCWRSRCPACWTTGAAREIRPAHADYSSHLRGSSTAWERRHRARGTHAGDMFDKVVFDRTLLSVVDMARSSVADAKVASACYPCQRSLDVIMSHRWLARRWGPPRPSL